MHNLSPTLEQLANMYITGLDFCILNNYPSNEYIKKHFGKIAEERRVYTDVRVSVLNPPIVILNGNCTGQIELTGFASRDIHVWHKSKVEIIIRDNSKAFIRVYDDAHVIVENQTEGRVYVYFKGGGTATLSGKVKTRNYE